METAEEFTRSAPMYGTLVAIGAGLTSLAFVFDWRPGQVFLLATGGTYTVVILIAFVYHLWRSWVLFGHDMALRKHDLEVMEQADGAAPVAPLQIFATTPTGGGSKTTIKEYTAEQIPPVDFIEWLFIRSNGSGRVPSERAIFEEWTATANPWLATLEEQGIIEKVGTNDNAPRRVVEGVTVAMARERFGYPPPPLAEGKG